MNKWMNEGESDTRGVTFRLHNDTTCTHGLNANIAQNAAQFTVQRMTRYFNSTRHGLKRKMCSARTRAGTCVGPHDVTNRNVRPLSVRTPRAINGHMRSGIVHH